MKFESLEILDDIEFQNFYVGQESPLSSRILIWIRHDDGASEVLEGKVCNRAYLARINQDEPTLLSQIILHEEGDESKICRYVETFVSSLSCLNTEVARSQLARLGKSEYT